MVDPWDLVRRLRSNELRSRTGLLLLPQSAIGREQDIAARLNVQHEDLLTQLLEAVPSGSSYLNLTLGSLFEYLDEIANSNSGMACVLVSQIDVAAMKLSSRDRAQLWRRFLTDFPYRRKAVLLGIPDCMDAIRILQERSIRDAWERSDQIAHWAE
jgi:hypothetical protein